MQNANKYAEYSVRSRQLASEIDPAETDPCAQSLKLAVYHLHSASIKLKEVAEYKAKREDALKGGEAIAK